MTRIEKQFDIPIPLQNVQAQWHRVQGQRRAQVRLAVIDEQHTRVHVTGDAADVDKILSELGGAAPGGSGGNSPGSTGGKPGAAP